MSFLRRLLASVCNKISPRKADYLAADDDVVYAHASAGGFAHLVHDQLGQRAYPSEGRVARMALGPMFAEIIGMHDATLLLCSGGRAPLTTLLFRTMLEFWANAAVITSAGEDADYMAFKYLHHFLLVAAKDEDLPPESQTSSENQFREAMAKLPVHLQQRLEALLSADHAPRYWYSPELKGPSQAFAKIEGEDLYPSFRRFSAGVHAAFPGTGIFKDHPDQHHPFPRRDRQAQNLALLYAAWCLTEFAMLRARFDKVNVKAYYSALREQQRHLRDRVQGPWDTLAAPPSTGED